jgi:hypothetical protein
MAQQRCIWRPIPALSPGVLAALDAARAGRLRAELIAAGQVREGSPAAGDLPRARFRGGNSLRGLIPAIWAG